MQEVNGIGKDEGRVYNVCLLAADSSSILYVKMFVEELYVSSIPRLAGFAFPTNNFFWLRLNAMGDIFLDHISNPSNQIGHKIVQAKLKIHGS